MKITEHSRKLRIKAAAKHQKKIASEGGRRLAILLYPPANAALMSEIARTGESAAAVINRALLSLTLAEK